MAHFFVITRGSKFHAHAVHFFVDIYRLHNNRAENAVRPFCVGRKNWLFSASVKGAEASAMMYSIAATACANGMNVEQYLTELFRGEAGTVVLPW